MQCLHESVLGQYLRDLPSAKVLEVYADPDIEVSTVLNKKLIVKSEERYENLSSKTYNMIDYCVRNYNFQHLLKIDVTTIMTSYEGKEYKERKPIELDKLIDYLKKAPLNKDYDGFIMHANATKANAESWASKKGGRIDYEKIFGDDKISPFYSGKCYFLSKRFARFVSLNGLHVAEEQKKYFLGAEDVMIGRLYQKFKESLLAGKQQ